jgi:fructoselysine 6-kinase
MVRIAAVGDNVVDCYQELGRMYPGGNCLNLSVFARRTGAETAYVGAIGRDPAGDAIRAALAAEGVSTERLRVLPGRTAYCVIGHRDGDRVFLETDYGVSMFEPDPRDFAFVADFDAVHVGQSSGLDDHLPAFAAAARLSYDFSIKREHPRFDGIAALCFLASFSGGGLSDPEARDLLARASARGARWALVTRGERGALLAGGGRIFEVAAQPCEVTDTLGAGDTFIAHTLVGLLDGRSPDAVLAEAARAAAETCTRVSAIGHGAPLNVGPASASAPARPGPAVRSAGPLG